jgi:hypothetical protein
MPKSKQKENARKKNAGKAQHASGKRSIPSMWICAIILVALAIAAAMVAVMYVSRPPSFSAFKSSFGSASQIAIFSMYNGTELGIGGSSAASCATAVIERLRRAPSTINFFEANQTNCTFASSGLGNTNAITTAGLGRCLNMTKGMPTLYIGYSTLNETVVGTGTLRVSGNLLFLRECGIAEELT